MGRRATPRARRAAETVLRALIADVRAPLPRRLREEVAGLSDREIVAAALRAAEVAADDLIDGVRAAVTLGARRGAALALGHGAADLPDRARRLLEARARRGWIGPDADQWSAALHGYHSRRIAQTLRERIGDVVQGRETAERAAQLLRDADAWRVEITPEGPGSTRVPRRIVELQREAERAIRRGVGDPAGEARVKAAFRRMREETAELVGTARGTRAIGRTLYREAAAAVRSASSRALQDAVDWWTWKREQVVQRAVVRHEAERVFSRAYVAAGHDLPWVTGWEWVTDAEPCEACQELGGRVLSREELVYPPLHPHCECVLVEVVDPRAEVTEEQWEALEAAERDAAVAEAAL